MQMISRSEAKAVGAKRYFTGQPCVHGHVAERLTSNGRCLVCSNAATLAQREREPEKYRQYVQATRRRNAEKIKQRTVEWRAANKEHVREYSRRYKVAKREELERYRKERQGVFNAYAAARRVSKVSRTPCWLTADDQRAIRVKYKEARWMSVRTGIKHVVDHFYPLQGKSVSGLHVPANLRVIPDRENCVKHAQPPRVERLPL